MEFESLIEEYKEMAEVCNRIDYSDKKSVKKNNKAVDRMYEIVNIIDMQFGEDGIFGFATLLDFKKNKTDVWASVHMLEKMKVDIQIEKEALKIIANEAKGSAGMEYWLNEYNKKRNIHNIV